MNRFLNKNTESGFSFIPIIIILILISTSIILSLDRIKIDIKLSSHNINEYIANSYLESVLNLVILRLSHKKYTALHDNSTECDFYNKPIRIKVSNIYGLLDINSTPPYILKDFFKNMEPRNFWRVLENHIYKIRIKENNLFKNNYLGKSVGMKKKPPFNSVWEIDQLSNINRKHLIKATEILTVYSGLEGIDKRHASKYIDMRKYLYIKNIQSNNSQFIYRIIASTPYNKDTLNLRAVIKTDANNNKLYKVLDWKTYIHKENYRKQNKKCNWIKHTHHN